jgi:hypothetical protein
MKLKDVAPGKVFSPVNEGKSFFNGTFIRIKLHQQQNVVNVASWRTGFIDEDREVDVIGDLQVIVP